MTKQNRHRIKAIETRYAGHLFRSRLEARWAAWFDIVGITWTYEPFDAAGYIPDFLCRIGGGEPFIVEVKGLPYDDPQLAAETKRSADRVRQSDRNLALFTVGCDPDFRSTEEVTPGVFRATGKIGYVVNALSVDSAAYLAETHASGDRFAIAGCDYFFEPRSACLRAMGPVDEMDAIQEAWGQAHEIARWMPVVGAVNR